MLCCCGLPLLYVVTMMVLPPVFAYRRRAVGRGRITAAAVGRPFVAWGAGLAAGFVPRQFGPGPDGVLFSVLAAFYVTAFYVPAGVAVLV